MSVMMHVHSGAVPDVSATPEADEPFNIQPGFKLPGPQRSEFSVDIGFCHSLLSPD